MMIHHARKVLTLSLIAGAALAAGCIGAEEEALQEGELALESAAPEEATCPEGKERITFSLADGDSALGGEDSACGVDLYFHPNNGSHGGYIESWRLCNEGGSNYRICTGGYAPVRYWNMSTCGGTVHDYYPQGWSGWAQSGGGCCAKGEAEQ